LAPIRERQLLTKEEITQLFANIEPIIELNKEFLKVSPCSWDQPP
jgi:hypothetical protein